MPLGCFPDWSPPCRPLAASCSICLTSLSGSDVSASRRRWNSLDRIWPMSARCGPMFVDVCRHTPDFDELGPHPENVDPHIGRNPVRFCEYHLKPVQTFSTSAGLVEFLPPAPGRCRDITPGSTCQATSPLASRARRRPIGEASLGHMFARRAVLSEGIRSVVFVRDFGVVLWSSLVSIGPNLVSIGKFGPKRSKCGQHESNLARFRSMLAEFDQQLADVDQARPRIGLSFRDA